MAEISKFRRLRRGEPAMLPPLPAAATGRRRRERWTTAALMLVAFVASAAVGGLLLSRTSVPALEAVTAAPPAAGFGLVARFAICSGSARVTCVVDGDTFWLEGVKYRVADIDTPEVSAPGCAAEGVLGRRATQRFAELLNAGPFELGDYERDEDRYGRKLRIVLRDGQSIGMILVAEGLAHHWGGQEREWC